MPITSLENQERRTLENFGHAIEVLLSHDAHMKVSDAVAFLHLTLSDGPLTLGEIAGWQGRSRNAGQRMVQRLTEEYTINREHHMGLNLIRIMGGGYFKLTSKGEVVLRSILALLNHERRI